MKPRKTFPPLFFDDSKMMVLGLCGVNTRLPKTIVLFRKRFCLIKE